MGSVLTPDQLEMLRRYLLELSGTAPFQHLHAVRQRLRDQFISEYELVECAKMLLLNHAYGHEAANNAIPADWLTRINLDLQLRDS
jgi:hypothetical protein